MAELKGYWHKILRIDLSKGTIDTVVPPEDVLRKYIGGLTLGTYYLLKEGIIDPKIKPFDPENLWQLLLGPMNGYGPNARSCIVTKSPYNFFGSATSGGQAAANLKFAGWDGIQIVGKASKPVYIEIIDDNVAIKDASHVWGKDAEESEMELVRGVLAPIEKRGPLVSEADMTPEWAAMRPPKGKGIGQKRLASAWVIGTGGENRVWYSNVITEGARAHGRHGTGAILGSKNCKGIVVRGTKGQKLADKATFQKLLKEIQDGMMTNYGNRSFGTARIGNRTANIEDAFPIRNWQWGCWSDPTNVKALDGPFMDSVSFVKQIACPGCVMHCMYLSEVTSKDPLMNGTITDMPDWEAMGQVGGMLGYLELEGRTPEDPHGGDHWDMAEALAKTQFSTFLHDNYGLDYIEGGCNLALVAELYQRGYITAADLDGIAPKWGDVHAFDALLKKIVRREGIGDIMANGTWETARYFAEKTGKPEIMRYSQTTHRYGQPAHGVRGIDKDALEYVSVERPNVHTDGGGAGFLKGDYAAAAADQNAKSVVDSLVYCSFARGHWTGKTAAILNAATGWDMKEEELGPVGARFYAMARTFNLYTQGIKDPRKEWDNLMTDRWFEDPLPNGPAKGGIAYGGDKNKLLNQALPAYWKARGWTEDKGVPTADTLKALGIDDFCEQYSGALR
ncbi:MAG: putative oxidoreductase YdhV [Chloroflexi bacterium ADurb.Bin180]|nr:MAG: putative oxidoreductase YdhV [Chloroflexi bacterium ADurb.Bin180]